METRQATVEDMLTLMEANRDKYPDFSSLPDDDKRKLAQLNIDAGTALSYIVDGKLAACGGIRMIGLGEAWLMVDPQKKLTNKKMLLRKTKEEIEAATEQGVWCMFATSSISENFLRHLGFEKKTVYVRVK